MNKVTENEKQQFVPVRDGQAHKERLASIDALRGFDMFWIIGGGGVFSALNKIFDSRLTAFIVKQLDHVEWEGFQFEDLIFPLFLFVVGAVLPFSVLKRIEGGQSRSSVYLHIIKRTVTIILLGLILNGLLRFNWQQMRWPGVLQRIGLCYFFAALLVMNTRWRTQAIVTATILLLYWAAMALVLVPGYGAGVITPEGCLSSYIDQKLLPGKIYEQYYGYGDNEGIISTLPAICTALIGALAGHWLRSNHSSNRKLTGLMLIGLLCLIAGYGWGIYFPVIKKIWTSSYVLVSAGYSLLLLAFFYGVIDVKKYKKWAFFFIIIGLNAITIYVLEWVVNFEDITAYLFQGVAELAGAGKFFILALGALMLKWLLLWFLYRQKIFLKV